MSVREYKLLLPTYLIKAFFTSLLQATDNGVEHGCDDAIKDSDELGFTLECR